ncbi:LCP family protein [Vagococcus teuberi]|nr:LCP family protein [Vagococcus teuberi]
MPGMSRMDKRRQEEAKKHETKDKKSDRRQPSDAQPPTSKGVPPKKKPKKKKSWGFWVLIVLVALIGLSGVGYAKGYFTAKMDKDNKEFEMTAFKGQKSQNDSVNILLLGSDSRGEDQGRSDSIMIAHYNKKTKQPQIVSIMRDTFVGIPTQDGLEYNKINAAYSYGGPEMVRQTIENNFGIPIQYYAVVNFDSFPKIIDVLAPRGLPITAEKDLEVEGTVIKKGQTNLSGHEALQYARFRKDAEGDFGRVRRQQQVMSAITKQATSPLHAWKLPEMLGAVVGYTQTDVPLSTYLSVGSSYLFSSHKSLEILTVPVEGSWENGYYDYAGSVLEINEEMNKQAIQKFFSK